MGVEGGEYIKKTSVSFKMGACKSKRFIFDLTDVFVKIRWSFVYFMVNLRGETNWLACRCAPAPKV